MSSHDERLPTAQEKLLLADVIERNIATLLRLRQETAQQRTLQVSSGIDSIIYARGLVPS